MIDTKKYKFVTGLVNSTAKAFFLLSEFAGNNILFTLNYEQDVEDMYESLSGLKTLYPQKYLFETVYLGEDKHSFLSSLPALLKPSETPKIVLVTPESLKTNIPSTEDYLKSLLTLSVSASIKRHFLTARLFELGYCKVDFVEQSGEYAVRGTVVDIFTLNSEKPIRIYFSLNKITAMKTFDIETQNTAEQKGEITVIPVNFKKTTNTPKDWFDKNFLYVKDETNTAQCKPTTINFPKNTIKITSGTDVEKTLNYATNKNINFSANIKLLENEIVRIAGLKSRPIITCLNAGELNRLEELCENTKIPSLCDFKISSLTYGFYHAKTKTAIITSSEILNRTYHNPGRLKKIGHSDAKRIHFKELKIGDYVVHEDYGIAKYKGIKTIKSHEQETDCLELAFGLNHKLFVPFYDFKKVQKFISNKAKSPRLSRLDKHTWSNIKKRVGEKTKILAEELLKFEAKRLAAKAPAFLGDRHIEQEFADSFPYEETKDQHKAIQNVAEDLTLPVPTERVLAGDVGFGKTEVAIRASLRTALGGKQTVVLVPTTILAAQHYKTFTERLAGFPVKIALLCRFQTKAEQKKILQDLSVGIYDIVIGTHRLLSKDVKIKQPGLVIIDEEHRFGVSQKEKIKALSAGTHCLLLSATPIPRTLNQALTNLKSISVIETPPQGRIPITTKVLPWDEKEAIAAIMNELARGGQVFYVHNRVKTLAGRLEFLKSKIPHARICMGHGQMHGKELEKTMWDFYNKKYDILLASTIIESGLDIPDVNTLIVENAHEFGLAQLYQLRGRIGRADKKAYCRLFYPPGLKKEFAYPQSNPMEFELDFYARYHRKKTKSKPEKQSTAFKRLTALEEFGALGSGLRLALRDMEIRGAGELLGAKQHGFVSEVGLFLYTRLLADEVEKLKGKKTVHHFESTFETDISAYIPANYLPDETERLNYYKRLINADYTKSQAILNQLQDLCGHLPESVKNIAEIINIRTKAAQAQIRHIVHSKNTFEFYPSKAKTPDAGAVNKLIAEHKNNIIFKKSTLGDGIVITHKTNKPFEFIYKIIEILG